MVFRHWVVALLMGVGVVQAGEVRVVATGENWVEVAVSEADIVPTQSSFANVLHRPGAPAVPVRGAILGMPFGSRAVVQVVDADYEEFGGIDVMPVPQIQWLGSEEHPFSRAVYERDEAIYQRPGFYPGAEAVIAHTGVLRDQQVAVLSLRPVQYDPVQRRLRIARHLRVRVQFVAGATRPAVRPVRETDGFAPHLSTGIAQRGTGAKVARAARGRAKADTGLVRSHGHALQDQNF